MPTLDLSHAGQMTDFWPGTNLTSQHNHECYGNVTLCLNAELLCTLQTCDLTLASYTYLPSVAGNALYAAIFGLCIIGQLVLGIKYKTWGFMFAATLGCITELIGYIGRIMLYNSPFANDPFLINLVCLTIAPAFLSAATYLCLARIVVVYGEELSRFRPRTYTFLFCTCDLISLILQAAGGAIASLGDTRKTKDLGIHIMLAGLSFQVFSLLLFTLLTLEFFLRLHQNRHARNPTHSRLYTSRLFKIFLISLALSVLTIFIRSCFRVAELSGGFDSALANDQVTFMVLEGGMIVVACLCLTALHPGVGFGRVWGQADFELRGRKKEKVDSEMEMEVDCAGGRDGSSVGERSWEERGRGGTEDGFMESARYADLRHGMKPDGQTVEVAH